MYTITPVRGPQRVKHVNRSLLKSKVDLVIDLPYSEPPQVMEASPMDGSSMDGEWFVLVPELTPAPDCQPSVPSHTSCPPNQTEVIPPLQASASALWWSNSGTGLLNKMGYSKSQVLHQLHNEKSRLR